VTEERVTKPGNQGLPQDSAPPRRKTTFWPILLTIIGGIALSFGSFYASCSPVGRSSDFSQTFQWALGPAFVLGVLATLLGSLWLIVVLVLHLSYVLIHFFKRK
jgi:uncharacterized membrane protein YedE/YeeE